MKVFLLFCAIIGVEVALEFALSLRNINNIFLGNSSLVIEVVFIAVVYALAINGKKVRAAIAALTVIFVCIWLPDKIFFEVPGHFNEEMAIVSRVFIIALSIIALHTVAKRTTNALTDEPLFWLASANILYAAGVIFVFGLGNHLIEMGNSYFLAAWNLNWSLDVLANIMFARGFLCKIMRQI